MTITNELSRVSDEELLRRLAELVRRSRRVEAALVAHIAEVDARRLYIREAPSMFVYCIRVLNLSEHEAYARITAARVSRRYPVLLAMLRDGRLHLSGIGKLAPHLTDENANDLLGRAAHLTKNEIEELVAAIAPKQDVAAVVRKLPVRGGIAAAGRLGLDRVEVPTAVLPLLAAPVPGVAPQSECAPRVPDQLALPAAAPRPSAVTPLSPGRYKVQFTASAELRDKLERLQALLRCDLESAVAVAVDAKLARVQAKRFGSDKTPRRTRDADCTASPRSRYLPAAVRRSVHARDGAQCAFRLPDGSRCPERRGLEFHHRDPYGRGGRHDPDNVCLMCRPHNAYVAELDYGKAHMERYRRNADISRAVRRASEASEVPAP